MNFSLPLPFETIFFIMVIVALCCFFHTRYDQKISDRVPTLLTTLGIFATFFAIAFGLLKFNVSNIQDSVPALLDGLKTAFWASVVGVGGALTFKFREIFNPLKQESYDDEGFNELLIEEIRGFRAENKELLEKSIQAQNEALGKIAKSSSDELIKALQEVIEDFNAKINEQFGENFKQLNEAVGKILVWQQQYIDFVDSSSKSLGQLIENFESLNENMTEMIENSQTMIEDFESFVGHAERFDGVAENLETTLDHLDAQRQAIHTQLTTLSNLVIQTSDNLPQIESRILDIVNTMKSSNEEFNRRVGELADNTEKQTGALQQGIEKALTDSLTTLGGQLGAMTEKFAADYNQLSDALVRISQTTRQYGR